MIRFLRAFWNSYLAALLLTSLGVSAQKYTNNPGYFSADSYWGKHNIRPGIRDTSAVSGKVDSLGSIIYWSATKALWIKTDTGWSKISGGINAASQVDTLPLVDSLEEYTGPSNIVFVTDPYRGGFFVKKANGSNNGITQFFSHDGDYWHRVYNPEDGILVDWAGADPTGVLNSAPAFQAAFAFSNHISCRANATYLITDSLNILNKTNFVLDGKNATIKESTSFYTTLLVKKGYKVTIKDLNFDGPENYAYFLTNDPASPKQHIYVDSTDWFTGYHLYSQNKRGMITLSNCSYYSLDDLSQDGIFKNGIASNVLGTFGIRIVGYGFNEPINYWTGKATINKFIAKNTGAAILVGDNATYLTISNCTFDSTYNNGIYISSGLWCSVIGNVMRNVGGTGIKARGFGYTITGNIITNADLGIVVTGNSAESFYGVIPTKYNTNGYSETVANNVIDTVSTRGIDVDFQDGLATHNTTITGNTVRINTSATDYILKVNTAGGTIISNNRFQGSLSTIGCYFQRATGDSTQTNIISNNIFRDFAGQGIHFQGLKRSIVSGNNFDSIGAAALVFENSTTNRIVDNTYRAGSVLNITSANGNSDNFISGNIGASITADNLTSILSLNYPNNQQNITGTPRIVGQTAVSGSNIYISNGTTANTNWIQLVPASRTISTTAPLAGGGDLTANRTISMTQANTSTNGWLSSTDWNTFNGKAPATGGTGYIQNQSSSGQTASFWITGDGRINNTLRIATSNVSAAPFHVGTLPSYANLSAVFEGNVQTIPAAANNQAVTLQQLKDTVYKRLPGRMVSAVSQLANYGAGDSLILVTDTLRGGFFAWQLNGTADGGVSFAGTTGYWYRVYNRANGINVAWYGPASDGATNDASVIQAAVNRAAVDSVGLVYLPKGNYLINTAILLPSNMHLNAHPAAYVQLAKFTNQYIIRNADLTNGNSRIKVTGGIWNGNGWTQTRSMSGTVAASNFCYGMFFHKCTDIEVGNLEIDSTRSWAIAAMVCDRVNVHDIHIEQNPLNAGGTAPALGQNGDGFTFNASNVVVNNISGFTNDDMIAPAAGGASFQGAFAPFEQKNYENISISNIFPAVRKDTIPTYRAVGVYAFTNYKLSNVTISNVQGVTTAGMVLLSDPLGRRGYFSNIIINNINGNSQKVATANPENNGQIGVFAASIDNLVIKGGNRKEKYTTAHVLVADSSFINHLSVSDVNNEYNGNVGRLISDVGVVRNVTISNVIQRDTLGINGQYLYDRSLSPFNTDSVNVRVSSTVITRPSGFNPVNVGTGKVSYSSLSVAIPDTLSLSPKDGDQIITDNIGFAYYKNGKWNVPTTRDAAILNQSSSLQAATFRISGPAGIGTSGALSRKLHVSDTSTSVYSSPISAAVVTGAKTLIENTSNTNGAGAFYEMSAVNGSAVSQLAYIGAVSNSSGFSPDIVFGRRTASAQTTEAVRISSAGYLGIGTTNPIVPLDVTGNGRFTGAVDANDANILGSLTTKSFKANIRTITASTSVTASDYTIVSTATVGNPTITLPAASGNIYRILVLVDEAPNTTTNGMNWTPAVKFKNSTATSFIGGPLLSAYSRITIQSDGTNWVVISGM